MKAFPYRYKRERAYFFLPMLAKSIRPQDLLIYAKDRGMQMLFEAERRTLGAGIRESNHGHQKVDVVVVV